MEMEKLGAYIVLFYMLATALAVASLRRRTFSAPRWIAPSWWDLSIVYAICNAVSCVLLMFIHKGTDILYTYWTAQIIDYRQYPTINLTLLLLAPIPLATWFTTVVLRWLRSSAITAARRETVRNRRWGLAPALRLDHGTTLPVQFRSHDFTRIDLSDDDVVREVARSQWQAIIDNAAGHGDMAAALTAQEQFLDVHLKSLPRQQAERIRSIYQDASMPHAGELKRITTEHRKQTEQRQERRAYTLRNIRQNTWLFVAAIAVAIILRVIWLFS